jgi:hypothetical protein
MPESASSRRRPGDGTGDQPAGSWPGGQRTANDFRPIASFELPPHLTPTDALMRHPFLRMSIGAAKMTFDGFQPVRMEKSKLARCAQPEAHSFVDCRIVYARSVLHWTKIAQLDTFQIGRFIASFPGASILTWLRRISMDAERKLAGQTLRGVLARDSVVVDQYPERERGHITRMQSAVPGRMVRRCLLCLNAYSYGI